MGAGGVGLVLLLVAGGFLVLRQWVLDARPPAPNLRCGNCPRLARAIRLHQLGLASLAVALVMTFAWGASR